MKTTTAKTVILAAILTMAGSVPCFAPPKEEAVPPPKKAEQNRSFEGKLEALDPSAKTLTVDGKMIYVSADTKITKAGQPIKLTDLKVGEQVHGTTRETFDGKTEALTVKVGTRDKENEKEKGIGTP